MRVADMSARTRAIIAAVVVGVGVVLAVWGPPPRHTDAGNTLMVVQDARMDSLDPAMSYQAIPWQYMVNVYDGLLTYHKAPAPLGDQLTPDLAAAMPRITDGGRTYSFTMRRGVMWGPPLHRQIQASDVKYGIQRTLRMASPGSGFYSNVHGEPAFLLGKAKDISGIVANDRAGTIVFHLDKPDVTFQYILAMPFSFAVPVGTPMKDMSTAGFVPASGPYMFTSYDPARGMTMARNPNFRQWSPDVPRGYVDGVQLKIGVSQENAVTMIQRGDVDYTPTAVPRSRMPELLTSARWKPHLYIEPAASTQYVFMNTTMPPFNSRLMRQAINWAIDRRAMVKLSGGVGVPSETILPTGFPGYVEHHLYPGPNMAEAKALVAKSGVTPGPIDVWCRTSDPNPTLAVYLQDVLTQLGFTPTVTCLDQSTFFEKVGDVKTHALIGIGNWGQDFPEGSDFIDVLLNGKRITPQHNNNLSWYSGADAQIARADALLDQGQRNRAWMALDRQIIADGAWAPFMHGVLYTFTSSRLKNYVYSPVYGTLLMQVQLAGQERAEGLTSAPAATDIGAGTVGRATGGTG
jgi:peptide/nickel transport system substrate-binding protein